MKPLRAGLPVLVLLAAIFTASASAIIPLTTEENVQASAAVFRGTVTAMSCFKDERGLIYTRTSLRVDESFKGTFPAVVQVVHRGGQVGDENEFCGFSPRFQTGTEYLLFVERGADGRLHCTQGAAGAHELHRDGHSTAGEFSADDEALLNKVRALTDDGQMPGDDVTDQAGQSGVIPMATTGMLGNVNARFLQPDRGEPIRYVVDADSLPAGITLAQATNALNQALGAWAAVTSLKFEFAGFQSFGQSADTLTNRDQMLHIQLHDNYHSITDTNVLGFGGRVSITSVLNGTDWDIGGNVAGNEFEQTAYGYVVLKSTQPAMQTLSTFAEVLCHEIGHALNMAHSSEVVTTDPVLLNSIMYFQAHEDGRGATLGSYDPPVIQQAYPSNTVPFGYNRYIDATTASATPNVPGINEIELRGYDLQTTNLTLAITNQSLLNGTFALAGSVLKYAPNGYYGFNGRLDPAGNSYKDIVYARASDGTNSSPYFRVRVVSFSPDSSPNPSDGIPDSWMTYYFGNKNPASGVKHHATDDFDGDGLSNFQEYLAGLNPTNAASAQLAMIPRPGTIQWQAKAYELYEIQSTTNLAAPVWTRFGTPVEPTNADISVRTNLLAVPITATVSNLPMTDPKMFFRVFKVP